MIVVLAQLAVIPDLACTTGDAQLVVTYPALRYYKPTVECGNLFIKSDIATQPLVRFGAAKPGKTYTLLYFSTESEATSSWPDMKVEGDVHNHWIVGNVMPAMLLGNGNLSQADELWGNQWPHHGPSPTQPYSFYLMEHDGPTPIPSSSATVNCFPNITNFCTHEQFEKWLAAYEWNRVGNNYLVGIYYNDTFRAPPQKE